MSDFTPNLTPNEDEQRRADQLAEALNRLLAGQPVAADDPLLTVATQLIGVSLIPSSAASARFEQQLAGWFGNQSVRAPRPTRLPILIIVAIVLIIIGLIIGIGIGRGLREETSTPANTPTQSATPTLTSSATATESATPTASFTLTGSATASIPPTDFHTPTATFTTTIIPSATPSPLPVFTPTVTAVPVSPTPIPFARVVISGRIDSISSSQIVILAQPILIEGGVGGLCINDIVVIEAVIGADGLLHAVRSALTIQSRGCAAAPIAPTAAPGKTGGSDDHHHNED